MATRIVVFDIETRKLAKDLSPDDEDYGWELLRKGKGGISALCIYDSLDNWLYSYDDNTAVAAARHIEAADIVVGYYSTHFDIPVLEGIIGKALRVKHHYDLYVELARGHAERNMRTHRGDLKLDTLSRKNLGRGKIDHGANIKQLIKDGQWGKIFNYCSDDVHLTYDLFIKAARDGGLINANGKYMTLPMPSWLKLGS
jgi:hypothetical protein